MMRDLSEIQSCTNLQLQM